MAGGQTLAPDCPEEIIFFKSKLNYQNDTVSIDIRNELEDIESLIPLEIIFLDSLQSALESYTINLDHYTIRFPFCETVGNLRYVQYKNSLGECISEIVGSTDIDNRILLQGTRHSAYCNDPDSLTKHKFEYKIVPFECSAIDFQWNFSGGDYTACEEQLRILENRYRIGANVFYFADTIFVNLNAPVVDTILCWGSVLGVQEKIITESGIYHDTLPFCACVYSYNVTLKDYQSLEVDLSDQFLCPGEIVRVSANAGFANYLWSTGEKTPTIFIDAPGAYSLEVESFNDCKMFYDFEIDYLETFLEQDLCSIGFDTLSGDYSASFDPIRKIGTVVYVISDISSGSAIPLDTISVYDDPLFHFFSDGPMTLQLAMIDVCGDFHLSENTKSIQQPVFLKAAVESSDQINLQWNPYLGREVDHYEVWLLQENAPDIFVDSVPSGTNNFIHLNAPTGLLKYYIRTFFAEEISCHTDSNSSASVISNVTSLLHIRPVTSQVNTAIQIFPNPTRGEFTIGGNIARDVEVLDMTGRMVLKIGHSDQVDLHSLLPGIYYLQIKSQNFTEIHKVIKI